MSAEFAIGRRAGTGTIGSYEYCYESRDKKKVGSVVGWLPLFGSLGIAIGYAIILGWVLKFFASSITGEIISTQPETIFSGITGNFGSIPWHVIIVVAVTLVLLSGVTKTIEKLSKVLMPLFFVLFLGIAIYVSTIDGAAQGYKFLFVPEWEKLLDIETWIMAMGQAFFSLSITGSGMIVYGAYLNKNEDIPSASIKTAVFDTIAALLSSLYTSWKKDCTNKGWYVSNVSRLSAPSGALPALPHHPNLRTYVLYLSC